MNTLTDENKVAILNQRILQFNAQMYELELNKAALEKSILLHEEELAKYPDVVEE